jgi:hypothetical protein
MIFGGWLDDAPEEVEVPNGGLQQNALVWDVLAVVVAKIQVSSVEMTGVNVGPADAHPQFVEARDQSPQLGGIIHGSATLNGLRDGYLTLGLGASLLIPFSSEEGGGPEELVHPVRIATGSPGQHPAQSQIDVALG